jgi:glycogen synthase
VAAYAKNKNFGHVFDGTKFFHIVHNLDPSYEGRLFPANNNNLWDIHQLPCEWLIDPFWKKFVVNPSRCALINSDQWGTVSMSYRQELMEHSPLQNLLKRFPAPFAFPNGIRK